MVQADQRVRGMQKNLPGPQEPWPGLAVSIANGEGQPFGADVPCRQCEHTVFVRSTGLYMAQLLPLKAWTSSSVPEARSSSVSTL